MKNIRFLFFAVILCLSQAIHAVQATEATTEELIVVYIYQLSRFVEWPDEKLHTDVFTVCTFPKNLFGEFLFDLEKRQIHDKYVQVKEIHTLDELAACHVVFLDNLSVANLAKVTELAQQMQILTISRQDEFIEQDGMVQLFEQEGRIRFSVNYRQSKNAALQISSKLLKLATKVIR